MAANARTTQLQQPLADLWSPELDAILRSWGQGIAPTASDTTRLLQHLRQTGPLWQVAPDQLDTQMQTQGQLLQKAAQSWETFPLSGDWQDWLKPLWLLWIPLAMRLDCQQRQGDRLWVQGILGGQGTGKTTLCEILQRLLSWLGQRAASLSIDDLYLTYAERQYLQSQNPRLKWRGPPGTHDLILAQETFTQLQQAEPSQTVALPQFDKSVYSGQGDRSKSITVPAPSIVLFEGWMVGARPLLPAEQLAWPWPIVTASDREFAQVCNERLRDYVPLWRVLDSLILLIPQDYRWSMGWRDQAERDRIAAGGQGLSKADIDAFVRYFWQALHPQLFIEPLIDDALTHLTVVLNVNHQPVRLITPASL